MAESSDFFHLDLPISGYLTITFHMLFSGEDLLKVLG